MAYTVSFVTDYIKSLIESDINLSRISVKGEVSDITYHSSGHVYFTLKDEGAVLSSIMYKSDALRHNFRMKTGDRVEARGRISVYNPQGKYQFIVNSVSLAGEGELYLRFLELKDKLERDGLFDPQYKRPIPPFVHTIGIVTSPTGAVLHDIIKVATRRNPFVNIVLCPALVQGEGAAESVARGIMTLNDFGVDVIIAGRGGGSLEELWAFNEEVLIQAIFSSEIPVISSVGHEPHVTLADFVADKRAATPTEAAEFATYDAGAFLYDLKLKKRRLDLLMKGAINEKRQMALSMGRHLNAVSPLRQVRAERTRLNAMGERLLLAINSGIERDRARLLKDTATLEALSPLKRLIQGYSYVTGTAGENISSISQVKPGDLVNIKVSDGDIKAEVLKGS